MQLNLVNTQQLSNLKLSKFVRSFQNQTMNMKMTVSSKSFVPPCLSQIYTFCKINIYL